VSYVGDDPAIGDEMGTVTDSFDFEKDKTGFMCVGVDTGGSKCLVRPFSSGGVSYLDLSSPSPDARVTLAYTSGTTAVELYTDESVFTEPLDYEKRAGDVLFCPLVGADLVMSTGYATELGATAILQLYKQETSTWYSVAHAPNHRGYGERVSSLYIFPIPSGSSTAIDGIPYSGTYTKSRFLLSLYIGGASASGTATMTAVSRNGSMAIWPLHLFRIVRGITLI